MGECQDPFDQNGGLVVWFVMMCYIFWGLAIVCEEYFVPALNVMCEKYGIPDDVAGATFMAIGGSSPELFAAMVGMFVLNSDVGTGTVVGSELFNMLMICAGSVIGVGRPLQLAWRVLAREVFFYALALVMLYWAMDGNTAGIRTVDFGDSLALVGCYGLYVLVCAFYEGSIIPMLCPTSKKSAGTSSYTDLSTALLPNESEQTAENGELTWEETVQRAKQRCLDPGYLKASGASLGLDYGDVLMHGFLYKKSKFYSKMRMDSRKWQRRWFRLSDDPVHPLKYNRNPLFPDEALRVVPLDNATDVRKVSECEFQIVTPSYTYLLRCEEHLLEEWVDKIIVKVAELQDARKNPGQAPAPMEEGKGDEGESRRSEAMELEGVNAVRRSHSVILPDTSFTHFLHTQPGDEDAEDELEDSYLEWPQNKIQQLMMVPFVPVIVAMHYTIPDVRRTKFANYWGLAFLSCLAWLAGLSYVMVTCGEKIGCIMNIPSIVIGLTLSAAGTSFPNLWSSVAVARQGFGNMAVSNAFGSNVFNIFIGLGVPWMFWSILAVKLPDHNMCNYKVGEDCDRAPNSTLACAAGFVAQLNTDIDPTTGQPFEKAGCTSNCLYQCMPPDGDLWNRGKHYAPADPDSKSISTQLSVSVEVLLAFLIMFMVVMLVSKFRLTMPIGVSFTIMYVVFLVWVIADSYELITYPF